MSLVNAKVIYMDGKILDVELEEEDVKDFSLHLKEGKVHWNKNEQAGFWTDISSVRYILFLRNNNGVVSVFQESTDRQDNEAVL